MALIRKKPTSPGTRFQVNNRSDEVSNRKPKRTKALTRGRVGSVGRSNGRVSIRHRQVGAKKLIREIDFKRQKFCVESIVKQI